MTRAYVPLLAALAGLWGASYLFIKVGVRGFEPATMMEIRVAVASVLLAGFLAWRGDLPKRARRRSARTRSASSTARSRSR